MTRPELGEWMIINREARKKRGYQHSKWERTPDIAPFNKPQQAMYIGWRTVHDSTFSREYSYDDDGTTYDLGYIFEPQRYHEVWLFVTNERRNPVYAFPEDVEPLPESMIPF